MIEGLRIEMTYDELAKRITERIVEHEQSSAMFDERVQREDRLGIPDPEAPRHILEHHRDEHLEQAEFLMLLRDHLVRGETYRLNPEDLRFADLTPDGACW